MIAKVKDLVSRTGESIKGFGEDPINNLGFLIPMAICLTSIISGIVAYIMFIVNVEVIPLRLVILTQMD